MDSFKNFKGRSNSLGVANENKGDSEASNPWKQMGTEEKRVAVDAEKKRVSQLPRNSSYATHRLRVLNKVLQLMSIIQRSQSQDEELELLFAGLSL